MKFQLDILPITNAEASLTKDETFFTQIDFIAHQGFKQVFSFNAISGNEVFVNIKFVKIDQQLISLPRSPFGGFNIVHNLSNDNFQAFVLYIKKAGLAHGVQKVIIKEAASFLSPINTQFVQEQLIEHKVYEDINQHMDIGTFDPEITLHKMQRRRMIRCLERNFIFQKEKIANAPQIHAFIAACRISQGIEINIPLDHFSNTLDRFPNYYDIFSVRDGSNIIACSVTVKTNTEVIYNYLPASDSQYSRYSPMVFLIAKMIEYWHFKSYRYFDLGISSINGIPQEGLRYFKRRIGAIESSKNVFEINL